jgi:hypothetical protein
VLLDPTGKEDKYVRIGGMRIGSYIAELKPPESLRERMKKEGYVKE